MIWALLALALWALPVWAGSLDFDGVDDKAVTTTPVITAQPGMIFAWLKPDSIGVSNGAIAATSVLVDNSDRFLINSVATSGFFRFNTAKSGEGAANADTTNAEVAMAWNSILAIMVSESSRKAILSGNLAAAGTNLVSKAPANISRFAYGVEEDIAPAFFYAGLIGSGAVWNAAYAWSDELAVALARGWSPWRFRRNLIWYAPYPEAGSVVRDWIGGNNLIISGGPPDSSDGPPARP